MLLFGLFPNSVYLLFDCPPRRPPPPNSHWPVADSVDDNYVDPSRGELTKKETGWHRAAVEPTERCEGESGKVVRGVDVGIDHNTRLEALRIRSRLLRH